VKRIWIAGALLALCAALAGGVGLYWLRVSAEFSDEETVQIADVGSERLTRLGSVVGFAGPNDAHSWLGIPYARPPVSELRWRAPARPEPWIDTLDALAHGPRCTQWSAPAGVSHGIVIGEEDCLRLDVWSPRFKDGEVPGGDARMPVLVFVRGDGPLRGVAGGAVDGSLLAVRQRLLVVSPSHRLGPLGWFAHPALSVTAKSAQDRSGNFGTLDLIAALRWVKENAEFFGGDPNNVTLVGQGSGGRQVIGLLGSQLARGYFHRAIVQSASPASVSKREASQPADASEPGHASSASEIALQLLIADGSASDRDSALAFIGGLSDVEVAEYLRRKTSDELWSAYGEQGEGDGPMPIRDGYVLPLEPAFGASRADAGSNEVPIMLGSNRDEMKLLFSRDPEHVSRRFGLLFRLRDAVRYERLSKWHSRMRRAVGVDSPALRMSGVGGRDVFAYRFDWDEEPVFLGADFGEIFGAARAMELPFVLGSFGWTDPLLARLIFTEANRPGREALSEAMMSYWAEFAYSGSPGRGRDGTLPEWRPWARSPVPELDGGAAETFLVLDTQAGGGIRMSADASTPADVLRAMMAAGIADAERCEVLRASAIADTGAIDGLDSEAGVAGCALR